METAESKKPPLGIMPKKFWQIKVYRERLRELNEVIIRYAQSGFPIDEGWVEERNQILYELQSAGAEPEPDKNQFDFSKGNSYPVYFEKKGPDYIARIEEYPIP